MAKLQGKVTLITGASSGIGEATALHFASLGSWLSLTGRKKDVLDKVAAECSTRGIPKDKILVVPGDISKEADVATVVSKTLEHFGKIDILFPNVVAYNLSKAGLDQLTRTAALELAADGVRVNAVNPGVIVTEVHKRGGMSEAEYAKFLEHGKTTHAMGRVGKPEEVAHAIAFLASDDASFITGQTLAIDGGRSIMCPR